jgi:CRISPR-associated protein Cas2
MYVILVYDIGEKRVSKALKLWRQYLCWIQKSVFEGELSEVKFKELKMKLKLIIEPIEDSVIIFSSKIRYNMDKEIIGKEKMSTDIFL